MATDIIRRRGVAPVGDEGVPVADGQGVLTRAVTQIVAFNDWLSGAVPTTERDRFDVQVARWWRARSTDTGGCRHPDASCFVPEWLIHERGERIARKSVSPR